MSNTKCWMMINSNEFYNNLSSLVNGHQVYNIKTNHCVQFSYVFDNLYKSIEPDTDKKEIVFAQVSVDSDGLSGLLNMFSFGGGSFTLYLKVHEILCPWKEK